MPANNEMTSEQIEGMRRSFRTALKHRTTIAAAMGIIIADHACDLDEAFALLREASQHQHRKLYDLACELVEDRSTRPPAIPPPAGQRREPTPVR